MKQETTIYITKTDCERLGNLIEHVRDEDDRTHMTYVNRLETELKMAEIVSPDSIPPDVVTMRSKVRLKDLDFGDEIIYSIVFPNEANFKARRISILTPLATALIGYKRGDTIEFQAPSRLRRLKIEEVLYQPESAGDYNL